MNDRLTRVPRHAMDAAQADLYGRFASGRRAAPGAAFRLLDDDGGLLGPPAIWLHSPTIGAALEQFGGAIRFSLALGKPAQEALILAVGAAEDSPFELTAHRQGAAAAGYSPGDVETIIAGGEPEGLDAESRVVLRLARTLLERADLSDDEFAAARAALGDDRLVEALTLVGYYRMIALQLRVYRIGAEGR